jgi:hypothetical protein
MWPGTPDSEPRAWAAGRARIRHQGLRARRFELPSSSSDGSGHLPKQDLFTHGEDEAQALIRAPDALETALKFFTQT